MKQLAQLIAFVVAIPLFGMAVGGYIRSDFQKEWLRVVTKEAGEKGVAAVRDGSLSLDAVCKKADSGMRSACDTYENVSLLLAAGFWCLLVGLSLIAGIYLAARLVGANRALLVAVFSPGLRFILLILFGLIITQGAILVYGAYIGEAYAIQRVHFALIAGVGLGALFGALAMIKAGLSITRRARSMVIGRMVSEAEQPELWALVRKIAGDVQAVVPRNIALGIAPNFYVTSADVLVYPEGKTYSDETLYLSLPLLRLLTRQQLTSVIGHELGHFKGEDTAFSLRFYPIYAGTGQAIAALSSATGGTQALALLPALATLSFFMRCFAEAENTIGRQREFEADKVGASVGSARALGTALLKIGAVVPVWPQVRQAMIDSLAQGKMFTNVSQLYADASQKNVTAERIDEVGQSHMPHPTDTHPSTESRIAAFGLSVAELRQEAMAFDASESAAALVSNMEAIEVETSDFEHRVLVATGQVVLPRTPEGEEQKQA